MKKARHKRDQEVTELVSQRKVQLRSYGHSKEGEHTSGLGSSEHLNIGLKEWAESIQKLVVVVVGGL